MRIYFLIGMMILYGVARVAFGLDPTQPEKIMEVKGENPWNLTAIFVSPVRRIAVIRGVFIRVGDKVDNALVIAIEPSYVILRNDEGTFKVFLVNKPVKTPAKQGVRVIN